MRGAHERRATRGRNKQNQRTLQAVGALEFLGVQKAGAIRVNLGKHAQGLGIRLKMSPVAPGVAQDEYALNVVVSHRQKSMSPMLLRRLYAYLSNLGLSCRYLYVSCKACTHIALIAQVEPLRGLLLRPVLCCARYLICDVGRRDEAGLARVHSVGFLRARY